MAERKKAALSATRHARVKEIFQAAYRLAPSARAALLDRECKGDAELWAEVESLLRNVGDETLLASDPVQEALVPAPSPDRSSQLTLDRLASTQWNEEQRQVLYQRLRIFTVVLVLVLVALLLRFFNRYESLTKLPGIPASGMA